MEKGSIEIKLISEFCGISYNRMADVFLKADVRAIFKDRKVLFMGDSVLRNLYQDFVYLVEEGTLTPNKLLKKKGNQIQDGEFPGDSLVEGGEMVPGRDYQEVLFPQKQ